MEHSNDISLYFLYCPECDTQWRSHHLQTCEHCSTMGLTLLLNTAHIEVLMEAVRTQCYGVNDETDILFVLSEMIGSDVPEALLAQACWMHLRTQAPTEEIMIAMEYFETRFQDSLQEYLMEAQAPPYPLPCASQGFAHTYPLPVELTAEE